MCKFTTNLAMLLMAAGLTLTACNQKEPSKQVKSNGLPQAGAAAGSTAVAIVDVDTLTSQYEYCKQELDKLEAKQRGYQQQLNSKGQALQNAMVNFQKKLQSGGFTTQQQAEAEQAKLQKQQQALQNFQMQVEEDMAKATHTYQEKLRKDLNAFLKEFNHDGRYKVIISKSGDNVLYADPACDITAQIVEGMNKQFKK